MWARNIQNIREIDADLISGITFSGIVIDNFESYMLGLSGNIGITSANYGTSIANLQSHKLESSVDTLPSNFIISNLEEVGTLGFINVNGDINYGGNLVGTTALIQNITISGDLRAPIISLIGVSTQTLNNNINQYEQQSGVSFNSLDVLINQNIINLSTSISHDDIKLGQIIGITLPNISNGLVNTGISIVSINQYYAQLGISTGVSITNLEGQDILLSTSINNLNNELNSFVGITNLSLSTSLNNLTAELALITGITIPNLDNDIVNLYEILGTSFAIGGITYTYYVFGDWGTTGSNITDGTTGIAPSEFETIQATFQQIQDVISLGQDIWEAFQAAQVLYNGAQALYNSYVLGYQAVNDANLAVIDDNVVELQTESATHSTEIAVINAALVVVETEIAGLSAYEVDSGVSISNLAGGIQNNSNNIILLGSSIDTNYNSIINLGASLNTDDIKISMLGVSVSNLNQGGVSSGISIANLNQSLNQLGVSVGISVSNLNQSFNQLGVSIGVSIAHLNNIDILLGSSIANLSALGVSVGISISNEDQKIAMLGVSVSNLNQGGVSSGISVSNLNQSLNQLGVSIGVSVSNDDSKIGAIIGVSLPKFLQNNGVVLPSTYTSSSLTSLGTITNLIATTANITNVSFTNTIIGSTGNLTNLTCNNYYNTNGLLSQTFNVGNNDQTHFSNNYYFDSLTGTTSWIFLNGSTGIFNTQNLIVANSLSVSGGITGPTITLIGTSIATLNTNASIAFGTSITNDDIKIGALIGITTPKFLQNNQTQLPATFTTASINYLSGFDFLQIQGTASSNAYIGYQNNSYSQNLCLTGLIGGLLQLRSPGIIQFVGAGIAEVGRISTAGYLGINQTNPNYYIDCGGDINSSTAIRISGNSLGTSISNDDSKIGAIIGVSLPKFLQNNGVVLPSTYTSSSLTNIGTLTGLTLNNNSADTTMTMNNGAGDNVLINLNSGAGYTGLVGMISSNLVVRSNTAGNQSTLALQIGTTSNVYLNITGQVGIWQPSPSFTLDCSGAVNGASYYLNGTGILNKTTIGSAVVNSSLTSFGLVPGISMGNGSNDNIIFYGSNGSSSNCYISFENSSTAINACLVGLVGGNLQMRTPGTYQFDNSAGTALMTLDSGGNALLAGGLKAPYGISATAPSGILGTFTNTDAINENVCFLANTNLSFSNTVLTLQTSIASSPTTGNYVNATANGVQTLLIRNNGNILNANNSYGSLSDVRIKTEITDVREYADDFKKIKFKKYINKISNESNLGVLADDLIDIFPSLVEVGNHDGLPENLKSVKYSVLNMIGMKVLQENITYTEQLEERIKKLEEMITKPPVKRSRTKRN